MPTNIPNEAMPEASCRSSEGPKVPISTGTMRNLDGVDEALPDISSHHSEYDNTSAPTPTKRDLDLEDNDTNPVPKRHCTDDSDGSITIVGHSEETNIMYLPVSSAWQRDKCQGLGLEIKREVSTRKELS